MNIIDNFIKMELIKFIKIMSNSNNLDDNKSESNSDGIEIIEV